VQLRKTKAVELGNSFDLLAEALKHFVRTSFAGFVYFSFGAIVLSQKESQFKTAFLLEAIELFTYGGLHFCSSDWCCLVISSLKKVAKDVSLRNFLDHEQKPHLFKWPLHFFSCDARDETFGRLSFFFKLVVIVDISFLLWLLLCLNFDEFNHKAFP